MEQIQEGIAAARQRNLKWRLHYMSMNSKVGKKTNGASILKSPPLWETHMNQFLSEKRMLKTCSSKNVLEEKSIRDGDYFRHVGPAISGKKNGPSGLRLALAAGNENVKQPQEENNNNANITKIDGVSPPLLIELDEENDPDIRKTFTHFHNRENTRIAFLGENSSVREVSHLSRKLKKDSSDDNLRIKCGQKSLQYRPDSTASYFDRVGIKSDCCLFAVPRSGHVFSYSPISAWLFPFAVVATPDKPRAGLFQQKIPSDFGMYINVSVCGRQIEARWFVCKYNFLFEFRSKDDLKPCGVISLADSNLSLSENGEKIIISMFESRITGHSSEGKIQTGTSAPKSRVPRFMLGSHGSNLDKMIYSTNPVRPQRVVEFLFDDNIELMKVYENLKKASELDIDDLYLFGKKKMGQGRFAHVLPAKRKNSNTNCAIKVVRKRDFWTLVELGKERNDTISREIATQLHLTELLKDQESKNNGVVNLRDVFETKDYLIMEMDLMDRIDLFQLVSQKKKLSEVHTAKIVKQLAKTIQTTQKANIAHRDIKLSNIVFPTSSDKNAYLRPKLTDFGMAAFVEADGLLKGRCGTPGYVAPEILAAQPNQGYENNVDIFSLGVICYTLLCGYEPFYGKDERKLIASNRKCIFGFDDRDWRRISTDAKNLITGLLEKNPEKRLTAEDVLNHPWIVANTNKSRRKKDVSKKDYQKHVINNVYVEEFKSSETKSEDPRCIIS